MKIMVSRKFHHTFSNFTIFFSLQQEAATSTHSLSSEEEESSSEEKIMETDPIKTENENEDEFAFAQVEEVQDVKC